MDQTAEIYDEAKVPDYTLPDPLVFEDGTLVTDAEDWTSHRRPEILALFEHHVYGRAPDRPSGMIVEVSDPVKDTLNGLATRKEIAVRFTANPEDPTMHILVYLPNRDERPAPLFLGLNFWGNHTIHSDPEIPLSTAWMRNNPELGIVDHRATEDSRGTASSRWPVEMILRRGYGLATIYCGDIDPDFDDGFENGVHGLFPRDDSAGDAWATISAWAWGLCRALDAFEEDSAIDTSRVAVMGHSRLGKTALWAGAADPRFALVISNNSGCGGAALSRRRFGETVERINTTFPHWFCSNFSLYNNREEALPVDQHELIALIAPRPVYVASAEEDLWADPRGEFLSAAAAGPVYELLGKKSLPAETMPDVNQPVWSTVGYHIRTGGHDVTPFDWAQYLAFADTHLRS